MTGTLFVHEYRRTRGLLGIIVGGAALVVLAGSLLALTGWPVLASLGMIAAILVIGGLLPVIGIALAVDYWRSAYGRMGYFTQSLPVKGSTIYGVRALYGLVVTIVASLITLLLLIPLVLVAAAHEAPDGASPLAYVVEGLRELSARVDPWWALAATLILVLSLWGTLLTYYFAASIGSGPRFARLGVAGPIVVYVLLYLVMQVLLFAGILAVPFGLVAAGTGLSVVPLDMWEAIRTGGDTSAMPAGFLPVLALVMVLVVWRTARAWNREVTLR